MSKTLISLISTLQAVKSAIRNTGEKPGPNTEIYGPRSEYGFLRTARRPIRMQDSSKPYNIYGRQTIQQHCFLYNTNNKVSKRNAALGVQDVKMNQ